MATNFLSLPSEVRNNIYEQLLLLQEPIMCPILSWLGHPQLRALTPGLLLANKTVHREASSILYAQNRFDFTMCTSETVASFLAQIGRNNAHYISHVRVDFPKFHHLDLYNVTIEEDSVRILAKIQSDCNGLNTLTTSRYSTNAMELTLDALDSPEIVAQAITLVDARFRAISSLQEIIVEVYEDGPSDDIRTEMKSHGWTISATKKGKELGSDSSFDDIGVDYDRYDDYDIDNDSDFWRRAAD